MKWYSTIVLLFVLYNIDKTQILDFSLVPRKKQNEAFFDNNKHRLYEQIISGTYHFTGDWDSISPEAKDFIESCLTLNPDDRMTADESLRHKWFTASNKNI